MPKHGKPRPVPAPRARQTPFTARLATSRLAAPAPCSDPTYDSVQLAADRIVPTVWVRGEWVARTDSRSARAASAFSISAAGPDGATNVRAIRRDADMRRIAQADRRALSTMTYRDPAAADACASDGAARWVDRVAGQSGDTVGGSAVRSADAGIYDDRPEIAKRDRSGVITGYRRVGPAPNPASYTGAPNDDVLPSTVARLAAPVERESGILASARYLGTIRTVWTDDGLVASCSPSVPASK